MTLTAGPRPAADGADGAEGFDRPVPLPEPRGPVSAALLDALRRRPWEARLGDALWWPGSIHDAMADEDLQLALFCVYELHHHGLAGVAEEWEWQPDLLRVRQEWEHLLLAGLEAEVGAPHSLAQRSPEACVQRLFEVARRTPDPSPADHIMRAADVEQLRELLIHRSLAELRAGDAYAWGVPRLSGPAKVGLVSLQHEVHGSGRWPMMRAELFRELLRGWQLDPTYGGYLGRVPGVALLGVNVVTLFASHRRWRGALVGHLAAADVASWLPNARLARGHRRLGGSEKGSRFFDEQLGNEAAREQLAAHDVVGTLVAAEPALAGDVVFGALCSRYADAALAAHILPRWRQGLSSLRPLPSPR